MVRGTVEWGKAQRLAARWRTIEAKMRAAAEQLRNHGAIVSRMSSARRVWSLRYDDQVGDRSVQRAIYIGGDDQPLLLARARHLLASLQAPVACIAEVVAAARLVGMIGRSLRQMTGQRDDRP